MESDEKRDKYGFFLSDNSSLLAENIESLSPPAENIESFITPLCVVVEHGIMAGKGFA